MNETVERDVKLNIRAAEEKPRGSVWAVFSNHPLVSTLLTGIFALAAVVLTAYLSASKEDTPLNSTQQSAEIASLKQEIAALKSENEKLRVSSEAAANTTTESFVIPRNKFMGVADKNYIISVDDIAGGVAHVGVKLVSDPSGFIDKKFLTRGNSIRLKNEKIDCSLTAKDVLGFAINIETKCIYLNTD